MDWNHWLRKWLDLKRSSRGPAKSVPVIHVHELEPRILMSGSPLGEFLVGVESSSSDISGASLLSGQNNFGQPFEVSGLDAGVGEWDFGASSTEQLANETLSTGIGLDHSRGVSDDLGPI